MAFSPITNEFSAAVRQRMLPMGSVANERICAALQECFARIADEVEAMPGTPQVKQSVLHQVAGRMYHLAEEVAPNCR